MSYVKRPTVLKTAGFDTEPSRSLILNQNSHTRQSCCRHSVTGIELSTPCRPQAPAAPARTTYLPTFVEGNPTKMGWPCFSLWAAHGTHTKARHGTNHAGSPVRCEKSAVCAGDAHRLTRMPKDTKTRRNIAPMTAMIAIAQVGVLSSEAAF